jgi:hypothetical protein
MPRNIPAPMVPRLSGAATTLCYLLKVTPRNAPVFGLTTADTDQVLDDGSGPLTYKCASGYTKSDISTKTDLSVNNAEADALVAEYSADGITADDISRGVFDGARFIQYLIDYESPSSGFVIVSAGTIGQMPTDDGLKCQIELRSFIQTLKQTNMIEETSITCRAAFGDDRCKMPLVWYRAEVTSVGAEDDRTFTFDPPSESSSSSSSEELNSDELSHIVGGHYNFTESASDSSSGYSYTFFEPGIVLWETGDYAGQESEIETFDPSTNTVTLVLPVPTTIANGDRFSIRQDCIKSKQMCITRYGNILNMRAEPELPLGSGTDLQSPTPQQ